jgi:hypothetical protein
MIPRDASERRKGLLVADKASATIDVGHQFPPGTKLGVHLKQFDSQNRHGAKPIANVTVKGDGSVDLKNVPVDAELELVGDVEIPQPQPGGVKAEKVTRKLSTVIYGDKFHETSPDERSGRHFTNLQETAQRQASTDAQVAAHSDDPAHAAISVGSPSSPPSVPQVVPPAPPVPVDHGQLRAQQLQASRDITPPKNEAEVQHSFGPGTSPKEDPKDSGSDAGGPENKAPSAPKKRSSSSRRSSTRKSTSKSSTSKSKSAGSSGGKKS